MTARTVSALVREQAAARPDAAFLICDDERLTFADLHARSTELAKGLLAAGAVRGSHIGLLLPNGADFAAVAIAVLRIGAVAVPMSTLSSVAELQVLVDRSDTMLLVATREYRRRRYDDALTEALELPSDDPAIPVLTAKAPCLRGIFYVDDHDLIALGHAVADDVLRAVEAGVTPSHPAVIVHTSGSTSAPKGVVHAHGALLDHLRVLNELREFTPGEILFSNSPFFWIGGFAYTFLGTLVAGATVLCSQAADPAEVLDLIERERPTMTNGYAASATALANDPSFPSRDLSSLRRGNLYSIMPNPPADPQLRTNMLGLTEGGSVVLTGTVDEAEHDLPEQFRGSFGRPTPDLDARIVDGELWLRGPALMLGYFGRERSETFDADGWYHTGDRVRRDELGHWYFLGRGDDMIKTAGANVSPAEVQDAIRMATGLESIAFGLPDADRGQVVAVALVVPGDAAGPSAAELRAQLSPMLSSYKIPRVVRALRDTEVPIRSSGKIDLTALKRLFPA